MRNAERRGQSNQMCRSRSQVLPLMKRHTLVEWLTSRRVPIDLGAPDRHRALIGRGDSCLVLIGREQIGSKSRQTRRVHRVSSDGDVVPASPDAVVPGVAFGLRRLNPESVAHGPTAQTVAALDLICNDPHLIQGAHTDFAHIIGDVFPK